jgi:cellulose synthase/poly-beta-1,6-N-acetylglucosamine synthase-like glycosyltransferase
LEIISVVSNLSIFLTALYVVIVVLFIIGWRKLIYFKPGPGSSLSTKVSVLVAARNEAACIAKTIDDLIAQNYDKSLTEIIIIDDHSTDRTADIVASYADRGVKLIKLNEDQALNSYKKKAIQTAIGQASGDLIVTTDADCRVGPNWLSTVVRFYETHDYKMISSPVVYFEERNFFERVQTLEFLYLIGLGASTIGNQNPSTCNGANLCYERKAFYEVGGFKGIDDLASGDDELLLHKIAAHYDNKVGFLKNNDAIVYTQAKPNLKEFIQQRKHWASKTTRYKNKMVIVLGLCVWLFNLSILVNAGIGLFHIGFLKLALAQLLTKILIEFIFLYDVTKFAKRKELLLLLPVLNLMHIVYFIYIGIAGNTGKYNWKGRMVK